MAAANCGVLTVSDRCSRGVVEDKSGPNLTRVLQQPQPDGLALRAEHILTSTVSDDVQQIQEVIKDWCDRKKLALVITTGGTGFSPRDVTPEATRPLLDREAPGMVVAMVTKSLNVTPMAMLSRPVCGIRGKTLIVNLPGSTKGSQECLEFLLPALPHALDLLGDNLPSVDKTHSVVQGRDRDTSRSEKGASSTIGSRVCPHGHMKREAVPLSEGKKRTKMDFHKVALRPRESPFPMLSVDDALSVILEQTPVPEQERINELSGALHRVLAEDITASSPLPPFPASVKDGYAVLSSDGVGVRDVLGPVSAGEVSTVGVVSGAVARITTGAPMPPGADAVVQVEDTELVESSEDGTVEKKVRILKAVPPSCDIRSVGSDIASGETVLKRGARLGPTELGLLATVGVTSVLVHRKPAVAVLSTGNEVTTPGSPLRPGCIYDSNKTTLSSVLRENGFECLDVGIARDDPQILTDKLTEGLKTSDVLITSGGVSMGEKDFLKPVLESLGAHIHFGRVFMKPGKPTTFATLEMNQKKKLIFSLPGNPVSCAVTFYLFVLPALKKMAAFSNIFSPVVTAKLLFTVPLDPRPEYYRAVLQWETGSELPLATSTGSQCSSRLLSMRTANALLTLPARSEAEQSIPEGSKVKAMLLAPM